ncbi:2-oxoglutarate (2OG) and Fe(II)-dependent oxygenase superfamily protein [Quillaja saponaria]|uniref:2-oxoglutarate (2OG) and Fe(II)-dependent oxygenase superfamily protein n=1 Tax=Quillaja saponaria TaxID=32244 RepID=A0AAD7LND7_QUISA|nr:2-oxoglutarate (2OG) and Fe(II)-dependent oxygenase superfamily protein [Quillaja saponaria]
MSPTVNTNSSNIIDFVVKQGNGVKGLVDSGLEVVPKQYIQPVEARFDASKVVPEESIPIIDFTNWDDPDVAESITNAASKWGFFQIVNHGVPLKVIEDMKAVVHSFFELPVEEKRKYLKENSPSETVVRLATSFSSEAEAILEWKDFVTLRYASEDEANTFWPPIIKNQAVEYMKKSEVVIKKLLGVLLKKLNVKEINKKLEYPLMGSMRLNLNYYPRCPNPEVAAGVGRHSDVSTITVLLQDEIGGLYVRGIENDTWVHVPPIDGALVINIGDVLEIISNGRYKSIEHQVVANRNKSRISIPIFVNPASDAVIGPLPQVLENGEEAKYKQVVYSDYFEYFFSKAHDGKKTIDYAMI